jgi:hypothetical protein
VIPSHALTRESPNTLFPHPGGLIFCHAMVYTHHTHKKQKKKKKKKKKKEPVRPGNTRIFH